MRLKGRTFWVLEDTLGMCSGIFPDTENSEPAKLTGVSSHEWRCASDEERQQKRAFA